MAVKPNEYKVYRTAEPEILHFDGVKDRNPSGFPTTYLSEVIADEGIEAFILFEMCDLCNTRGEARRLIKQGGGYRHVHGTRQPIEFQTIKSPNDFIGIEHFENGVLYLRAGKKKLHRLEIL